MCVCVCNHSVSLPAVLSCSHITSSLSLISLFNSSLSPPLSLALAKPAGVDEALAVERE